MLLWVILAGLSGIPDTPEPRATLVDDAPERLWREVLPAEPLTGPDPGDEILEVRGRLWFAQLSGHFQADATVQGTRLSVAGDTDLGSRVEIPELQAHLNIPFLGRLYLGWWDFENQGHKTLSRTITFEDHTYTAGTSVHAHLGLSNVYATYEFVFPKIPIGPTSLELGLELGLRELSGDASVSDSGQKAEARGSIPAPVLGARAIYQVLPWLRGEAEIIGIKVSIDHDSVSYVETFVEVVAEPLPWLFGGIGYKSVEMADRYRARLDIDLDLQLSGVYLTVGVRF